jgi:CheY-like chemotaxis protein
MAQRLLVVDSDRSFFKEHQISLEAAFDVDFASSPEQASARLESGAFAAVLICVEVSENKGYSLCSSIRKNPNHAPVKIALISGKATEEEYRRHQSLKGKADLYLHKPIAPGALVAALSPLVPPRMVDPDNPLGDLTEDLGEEWLDSLKDEFDAPAAPPAMAPPVTHQTVAISLDMLRQAGFPQVGPKTATTPIPVIRAQPAAPPAPAPPANQTVAVPMAELKERLATVPAPFEPSPAPTVPSPDLSLLEARIQELEANLASRDDSLSLAEAEIERLATELEMSRGAEARATKNLDEADRLKADLDQLHARLKDREEALKRTREDFEALQRSHDSVTQNLDEMEKRQSDAEALREKLGKAEEALARLEQASAKDGEGSEALKNQLRQAIEEHHDLLQQIEQLNDQMADKNQRVVALLKERDRLQQQALEAESHRNRAETLERDWKDLSAESERLKARLAEVEPAAARVPELEGLLGNLQNEHDRVGAELADAQARHLDLQNAHDEIRGRHEEATRSLEGQSARIQNLEHELEGKEATLRAQGRDLAALESSLKNAESQAVELRAHLQEKQESVLARMGEIEALQAEKENLAGHCIELERQIGRLASQSESEKLELLHGLDDKEAELGRIQANLDALKQTLAGLEGELGQHKSALADRNDRLGAMSAILGELGERIQRGADLTKNP